MINIKRLTRRKSKKHPLTRSNGEGGAKQRGASTILVAHASSRLHGLYASLGGGEGEGERMRAEEFVDFRVLAYLALFRIS